MLSSDAIWPLHHSITSPPFLRSSFPLPPLLNSSLLLPLSSQEALGRSAALAELRALDGLSEVKSEVEALLDAAVANAAKEEAEEPVQHDLKLHRVFVGNPGTGAGNTQGRPRVDPMAQRNVLRAPHARAMRAPHRVSQPSVTAPSHSTVTPLRR